MDQLAKLSAIRAKGDINEAEFQQAKEKTLKVLPVPPQAASVGSLPALMASTSAW
ncbi:SHOCT domain-containing protein [Streptomyces sviceus]|uniref:SHOCT domain-containing protein n=1 Tax=Streptomyces sviceus TaxID=285530 RepID=UPI0036E1667D